MIDHSPIIAVHGATGKLGSLIQHIEKCQPIFRKQSIPACDVVIDVSSPDGLKNLIPQLTGQALLIGTTGDLPLQSIHDYAKTAPVAIVPNFSVGIPLLLSLIAQAIPMLPKEWDIEIVEVHHNQKKDSPSGTAKRLQQAIMEHGIDNVPIHALRVGDTFGEHTVWLCGPGERIELKHVATKRDVFAIGAIRWAKWLYKQPVGLVQP